MKHLWRTVVVGVWILTLVPVAYAHFGMIIPTDNMVMQQDPRTIEVTLSFSHPMEYVGMELVKPKRFVVYANGQPQDLKDKLLPAQVMGHSAWSLAYAVRRPGIYMFVMEPEPYWEPAEDCFIIHITKTVVAAFGDEEGWDAELGLRTEIVPLTRPFGLYAGNLFQGVVKLNGQPVPNAEVEVEYYNADGQLKAPTDYMVTQVVKADRNGLFSYAAPHAGWWGFAALNTADSKIKHEGREKSVELGAVLWVHFENWP